MQWFIFFVKYLNREMNKEGRTSAFNPNHYQLSIKKCIFASFFKNM